MNRPTVRLQQKIFSSDTSLEGLVEQLVKIVPRRNGKDSNCKVKPTELENSEVILDIEIAGKRYLLVQYQVELPEKIEPMLVRDCTTLSPREQEIARMVMKGYPNKTIAAVLDISVWTVGTHLRRIFSKLGVGNRASMVAQLLDGNHINHE
jgi:DNA-binding CsgD family transcriptional regulator